MAVSAALALQRLCRANQEVPPTEKPEMANTRVWDSNVQPKMVGGTVGLYNSKTFTHVDIKPKVISCYLGESSSKYNCVHERGWPTIWATHSSSLTPIK